MNDPKAKFQTLALLAFCSCLASCGSPGPAKVAAAEPPSVERYTAPAEGIFANAYLIKSEEGLIVVDASLRNSDSRALLQQIEAAHEPLLAIIVTHGHPDHYNGLATLAAGRDIPIYASSGVTEVARRDDAAKEAQWKPIFGDEWPAQRRFPDHVVGDGESIRIGGVELTCLAMGPAESHDDSVWLLATAGQRQAFVGDLVFNGTHSYMTDGHTGAWLRALDRLQNELSDAVLYPGHGEPGGAELIEQQRRYLKLYRDTVERLREGRPELSATAKAQLVTVMKQHLATDRLQFLIELGGDAVAAELAAEAQTR
jgi:glyoxylase-like metal-dependent hydrolase (beta-lactamase superfamily II)